MGGWILEEVVVVEEKGEGRGSETPKKGLEEEHTPFRTDYAGQSQNWVVQDQINKELKETLKGIKEQNRDNLDNSFCECFMLQS